MDAALAGKANKSEVDAALASKANKSEVDAALAGKANKSEVDAAIENKADKSALEAINASVSVNTSNIQELSTESTVLSARMDEFTKLKEGSTTGDAELTDGRVGADGKTYTNIGGAIRGQVTDLKSDLNQLNTDLAYLIINWNVGKCYDKYGVLVNSLSNYKYTDIISIKHCQSVSIKVYLTDATSIVLFNNEKVKSEIITGSSNAIELVERTINSDEYGYIALCSYYDDSTYIPNAYFVGTKEVKVNEADIFNHSNNTNYINGFYENVGFRGNYVNRGMLFTQNGFYVTKPVELEENTNYYYNGLFFKYYAFFDENMNWISGANNDSSDVPLANPFTIPSGAKYGVFTCLNETNKNNAWIYTSNEKPIDYMYETDNLIIPTVNSTNPIDYNGKEVETLFFGIACGDSLTEGTFNTENSFVNHQQYAYPFYFYKQTNVYLRNFGVGGTTAQSWYERYQSTGFPVYDFAIIAFGVNDLLQGVSPDTTTQYIDNIVNKLKSSNDDVKCFIATVNKAYITSNSHTEAEWNAMNNAIRNYANSTYNCYLLDIAQYGKTEQNTPYVNGHLTAIGYNELAREYANLISWNIKNNISDFNNIQFSGTDKLNIPTDLRDLLRVIN